MTTGITSLVPYNTNHFTAEFHLAQELLEHADIRINGARPWDMQVYDERVFHRVLNQGNLGLGESYMDGWWDCFALDEFFYRVLRHRLHEHIRNFGDLFSLIKARLINLQNPSRVFQVGEHHYDIGNDLYQYMLDKRMIYSCGYWKEATDLDSAQEAKLDLVCQKLQLEPGMKVLDIGCGWGGTAKYMAEKYKVQVIGVTVSKQQAEFARENCKSFPVDIRYQDYRVVNEQFDRILAIGMFEHVGVKNYRTFMEKVHSMLPHNGLFLLHSIGNNKSVYNADRWTNRYIFPNSTLPSANQITQAYEGLFVMEDWHCFGQDYDFTLMAWKNNFESAWEKLQHHYSARFRRMWDYYLLSNAGSFRARDNQLWQILLSPTGVVGGIRVPR